MSWYDDDDYSDIYDPDDDTDYEAEEADEKHMAEFAKTFVKGDCPRCGGKTRTQLRPHTVLEDFPLFCPKCRYTFVIRFQNGKTEEIEMPDA